MTSVSASPHPYDAWQNCSTLHPAPAGVTGANEESAQPSVIGASTQRPNATGVGAAVDAPFEKRIDGWINPAAFSQASQFTFGNVGRVISLRGPGQISFDGSLFKTFSLMEKLKAQFNGLDPVLQGIHRLENEGDEITRVALQKLFDANHETPADLIKWKDIYALLESTLDECESVAEIMETIEIKNA